jgi:uncharacterized protein
MITKALLQVVLSQYQLPYFGIHGVDHWARVLENGRRLCQETGAQLEVVELFALFHDARRKNEHTDFNHGRRGADLAASLRGTLVQLDAHDFDLLYHACTYHTHGHTKGDITVQTCWDADRLDLGRAGIAPHKHYLCTLPAKDPDTIAWANERSWAKKIPAWISTEWGLPAQSER